jgi:hypothetical protein
MYGVCALLAAALVKSHTLAKSTFSWRLNKSLSMNRIVQCSASTLVAQIPCTLSKKKHLACATTGTYIMREPKASSHFTHLSIALHSHIRPGIFPSSFTSPSPFPSPPHLQPSPPVSHPDYSSKPHRPPQTSPTSISQPYPSSPPTPLPPPSTLPACAVH